MNISPKYRDCLRVVEQINKNTIPELDQLYKSFAKQVKNYILGRDNLNTCRMYTLAAKESLSSGKIDNKHVRKNLEVLRDLNKTLSFKSDSLDSLCRDINKRYVSERKKIEAKNVEYLQNIKGGVVPAEEMVDMLIGLGNRINKLSYEGLSEYLAEIKSHVKQTESKIVDNAFNAYRAINKLDSDTFGRMVKTDWTKTEFLGFFRSGAYEQGSDYMSGVKG